MYNSKSIRTNRWTKSKEMKKIDGDLTSRQSCRSGPGSPWIWASSESICTGKRMSKLDDSTGRRTSNTARRSTCVFVDMALFLASTSEGHLLCWSALQCIGLRTRKKMDGDKLRLADHGPPPPEQPGPKQPVQRNTSLAHDASYPPMHHTKHNLQVTKKTLAMLSTHFAIL
jgi:hypothetical protein